MPHLTTPDNVKLYYEETGDGQPVVFVHEFGGDLRSWQPQIRYFARHYRCIAFNARGYPPSDVPSSLDSYSQEIAVLDIRAVLDSLKIETAHIVGLSMGGFAALHFGLQSPKRVRSIVIAGTGYGAEKQFEDHFRSVSLEVARQFEIQGSERFSKTYSLAASRIPYLIKDPQGWREFCGRLGEHSSLGSALTMRGVQARRRSIYEFKPQLEQMETPTLVVVGDEDDHCLQPGIFLKRTIPACGLLVLPRTGHTLNLEEPVVFNQFVAEF